uniref:Uncharacterized protein n=1 Tax=Erpetoichthys calabaricus TaxID=27687 RepID=A0A8C4X6B7_ERPCA
LFVGDIPNARFSWNLSFCLRRTVLGHILLSSLFKEEDEWYRAPSTVTTLRVLVLWPRDLMIESSPRRVFVNAHAYHINFVSVKTDFETYLSADDFHINLWHLEITDCSFNIVEIKPANMGDLTDLLKAAEFHPDHCNKFLYSSTATLYPSNRSFFSEIISSISDVKFSHNGHYMMIRKYPSVKIWNLNMETRTVETYQVHEYLRHKLCMLSL